MPQGFAPDEGAPGLLAAMLVGPFPFVLPWTLVLWTNDFVPDYSVVVADLVEPSFNGYVRMTLDSNLWTAPVANKGCTTTTYGVNPVSWSVNAATTDMLYGFAIWDRSFNVLRWIQRFEPPDIAPLKVGDNVTLLPTLTLTSAACAGVSMNVLPVGTTSNKRA